MKKAFTLVELLFVVIILAILLGIATGGIGESTIYGWWKRQQAIGKVERAVSAIPNGGVVLGGKEGVGEKIFSSTVVLETSKNNFLTFTSVDRQFAGVKKGDCIQVSYDPYAPWAIGKNGTYHNGRLLQYLPKKMCQ